MKEGRKPEYQEETADDELQIMPHATVRKFNLQPRLNRTLERNVVVCWLLNVK